MGFITIWYNPIHKYLKTYRDANGNVTKTKTKSVRSFYEGVMRHANKNPDITAKIVSRAKDGFIAVDASIKRQSFS